MSVTKDIDPPNVPVLETERLRLRGHRVGDLDASAAMWADPVVRRYTGATPSTLLQSWSRMRGYVGHWVLLGFGYWVVEERVTANFIGELGFADFKRGVPEIEGIPEIGWALTRAAHGKGYATEGVRAAIAWGEQHLESK
nr:GNAT family N-acetyltransferase [Candidatus Eremiobacteraeota bacterium]